MKEYLSDFGHVMKSLSVTGTGLSSKEAKTRLEKNGKNRLAEQKPETWLHRFLKQLSEPMTIILIVAAAIAGIMAVYENHFPTDVIIIMAVVIINAVLGVLQESKAEKSIAALQKMAAATSKVIRDGRLVTVPSEELVVGDVIVLEAGDAVPADARIIEAASLKIEEAALTGESVPVTKTSDTLSAGEHGDVSLGDRRNMVFSGSTVVYGRGKAVVTHTGMDTEMGKIADALTKAVDGKTPLQIKLAELSNVLTKLVIGICIVIFAINIVRSYLSGGGVRLDTFLDTFMIAVSLAVAAIPEGLATVVTIVLSIGVTNMSKRSAIIRKLTAVETLGCTQIICSDKTGTLTQNKMTVVESYGDDEKLLALSMSLASDAELDSETKQAVGEPTECALVNYAYKLGYDKESLSKEYVRIGEAPFSSERKMMSTVHRKGDGSIVQFTKGAPDELLKRCTKAYIGGEQIDLTEEKRSEIMAHNKNMADRALRVLASAMRIHGTTPTDFEPETLEGELCFVGLVGMIDPVRDEVKDAISECRSAGIRPIMITGDHKDTAVAIARELKIIESADEAMTGAELSRLSDEEFDEVVTKYSVYARVQPEHKTRIVRAWQKLGKVTAMTGDGVNDAPSIKNADIGVGMGITGTDVTKNVADMILADDNFATIVSAVGEGRRIYDNIRKCIQFLLASNLSEVLSIFFATLMGFTLFRPVHLLWINLVTDCLPALALGMEKPEKDIMNRSPRSPKEGVFSGGVGSAVIYQGIIVTVITLVSYFIGHDVLYPDHLARFGTLPYDADTLGTSMAFLSLALAEICHSFNLRSLHGSLFAMKKQNLWLWGAAAVSFVLVTVVVEVPFLANAFSLARLDHQEYGIAFLLALTIIPIEEVIKVFLRRKDRKKVK
ncbi:MAG: calcium-translocating P-type ATPase, PMCA-type [Oscillospiraceae bacterium]|nr:calcium-translocating P-type ATPase, PMCA-type [Oscillospiraceae bacterium]